MLKKYKTLPRKRGQQEKYKKKQKTKKKSKIKAKNPELSQEN